MWGLLIVYNALVDLATRAALDLGVDPDRRAIPPTSFTHLRAGRQAHGFLGWESTEAGTPPSWSRPLRFVGRHGWLAVATIRDAGRALNDGQGKLWYPWAGLRCVDDRRSTPVIAELLRGNGDMHAVRKPGFGRRCDPDLRRWCPDDGVPQVGAATSRGAVPRVGIPGQGTVGHADRSLFRWTARADAVDVRLGAPVRYELDGGERPLVSEGRARATGRDGRGVRPVTRGCLTGGG
jgi:hypothetical protein